MAKELQFRLNKAAFTQVSIQLVLSEQLQGNLQVLVILSLILAEGHYVIQVDQNELTKDILQHIIQDFLAGARLIGETKTQHPELIQSQNSCECSFRPIARFQPDLVVRRLQVNAAEDFGTLQLITHVIYAWAKGYLFFTVFLLTCSQCTCADRLYAS